MNGHLIVATDESPREKPSTKRARLYAITPLAERFRAKVDTNGPVPPHRAHLGQCWTWTGSADRRGYGQVRAAGRGSRLLKAHRVAWAMANGPLAPEVLVLHRCDNPGCVRPSHLFEGTQKDNCQDARSKGRLVFQVSPELYRRGEQVHGAKLTASKVEEIRRLHGIGLTQAALAKRFGVSQQAVSSLVRGKTWRPAQRSSTSDGVRASAELFGGR